MKNTYLKLKLFTKDYYYYFTLLRVFPISVGWWFSLWSLSDNKSPQVFRTLLGNLADLNNVVIWVVFTRPLISKSSIPCTNTLVTVPSAPVTIGITVTLLGAIWLLANYLCLNTLNHIIVQTKDYIRTNKRHCKKMQSRIENIVKITIKYLLMISALDNPWWVNMPLNK